MAKLGSLGPGDVFELRGKRGIVRDQMRADTSVRYPREGAVKRTVWDFDKEGKETKREVTEKARDILDVHPKSTRVRVVKRHSKKGDQSCTEQKSTSTARTTTS